MINLKKFSLLGLLIITTYMLTSFMSTKPIVDIYETSKNGNKLTLLKDFEVSKEISKISLNVDQKYQTISGFGGAFTESSAHLLNQMSDSKRNEILKAYFSDDGAAYSMARTHMNSCDFSLDHYSYSPILGDKELKYFSIDEDREDLIPMIKMLLKYLKVVLSS